MKVIIRWVTPLEVREVTDTSESLWAIVKPFKVRVEADHSSKLFTLPKGYVIGFAHVPRLVVTYDLIGDEFHKPATIHDWLYSTLSPIVDRSYADAVLFWGMRKEGYNYFQCYSVWFFVRLFGWRYFRIGKDMDKTHPGD